jgi:hypothetical protein
MRPQVPAVAGLTWTRGLRPLPQIPILTVCQGIGGESGHTHSGELTLHCQEQHAVKTSIPAVIAIAVNLGSGYRQLEFDVFV